ncbi:MAG: putative Ig domain-containing protein, partial [Chloroflexi bacterium]|nr:putative Ig domain-containing protein [Chloroflexota bacterium]
MRLLEPALAYPACQRHNRRRVIALGTLPLLMALILVVLWNVHAQSPSLAVVEASGDGNESATGPCEDGWIAPTPVAVAVAAVPVVVSSTTADYFVLYATIPAGTDTTRELPISVTRGEDGTTTLTDRLQPLSKDKYRVEKYQVASPGDLDGDCVDDITELDGMGEYNPLNPGKKIGIEDGSIAVDSEYTFNTLKYRGHSTDKFAKFVILDFDGANPYVYFINVNTYNHHDLFVNEWNIPPRSGGSHTIYGSLTYGPNVVASDGSLGVYYYTLTRGYTYWQAHQVNELLAAAMPLLENNLAYKPHVTPRPTSLEAKHTDARLVILEDKDIHPDVAFVSLNQAEGYGLLRLMEDGDEPRPIDIAIYKSLPNDLPHVAGTITTIPQTPLSHVNLRAIQNNVPNAFIRDILKDEKLTALIGKHVYYAVTKWGYTLREATKNEVDDHHAAARPTKTQTPERDLTVTKITALADISFDDWDAFGVKAANMAELSKLSLPTGTVPTGHAVPFYFYDEFMKNAELSEKTLFGKKKWPDADKLTLPAGTKLSAVMTQILAHPRFRADYEIQEEMLDDLRDAIKDAESPDWIITALEAMHSTYPDGQSLRYRSSTNNEDLPAFNGAGLYSSKTQDPDETTKDGIDKSIKAVWASLWNFRAFLEREYYRVDHTTTAMGVLVHPNFSGELANGVAVSADPIRFLDDMYYVNTQVGEDLVTNPQPNSFPEELLLDANGNAILLSRSSLAKQGWLLMTDAQMVQLRNNLKTIHDRFKTLYNVKEGDDFAIEIEFKITADNKLAIKQARPWVFPPPLSLTPAVTVPTYSATAPSTKENRFMRFKLLKLIPNERVKWSMTGPDADMFILWASNGKRDLYFRAQDYENPADADGDNVYRIVLTATDSDGGKTTTIDFSVTVYNDPDDDSGKLPVLSIHSLKDIGEGGPARFIITADPVPEDWLTIALEVTEDGDYAARTGWDTTHIDIGDTSSHFTVWTINDDTEEPDGSVTATLVPGTGHTISADKGAATVNVADNDGPVTPEVSVTAGSGVTEGGDAQFTVTASPAPAAPLSVNLTVGQDGDFGATTGSQTVTIPTSGSAPLTVGTTADDTDETDGSVSVTVDAGDGYTTSTAQGAATVSVADNDGPPTPEVSVTAGSGVTEGGSASFTVTASPAPTAPLSISVTVTASGDYGATTGSQTVTIPTAGSATVTVGTTDDDTDETDGSVSVSVDAGDGYTVSASQGTATVSVADSDDPPPATPEISVTAGSGVTEGGEATFTVTATPAPSEALSVSVTVTQDGDFGATTGAQTVSIPTSGSATVTISTTDDDTDETGGSVSVTVDAGDGYTVSTTQGAATVGVADNDDPPPARPEVNISGATSGEEGQDVTFTLLAAPAPAAPLAVSVTVTASGDFGVTTGSQSVTIQTSGGATVTIGTTDDTTYEPNGSVTLTLSAGSGYTVGSLATETASVLDNDAAPLAVEPEISVTAGSGITEGGDAQFTITASPAPSAPLSVSVTATQQGDYGATTGTQTVTVTTSGSTTVTVGTTDDSADEPNGSVSVSVNAGDGYTVSPTQGAATMSVADNDAAPVIETKPGLPAFSSGHVGLISVKVGEQIKYTPPTLNLNGAGACTIGVGLLLRGSSVVRGTDNGFKLSVVGGVPRMAGRAQAIASTTRYTLEYVCGAPQGWRVSYTVDVQVIPSGMTFRAAALIPVKLVKDQELIAGGHHNRPINPPELLFAQGNVAYAVSPALPAGLSLDALSGVISGTPTAVQGQATYTIRATDSKSGGAQTASYTVSISVFDGMRWAVSSLPDQVFEAGERIEINPPELLDATASVIYGHRSSGPSVLHLHPYSGRLLASSADPMVKNTYTVTAMDAGVNSGLQQQASFTVNVEVIEAHYLGAGQAVNIPPMALPNLSGVITYSLPSAPALPTGLSFDSSTGVISGTLDATETQAKQTYTVTGTDENGVTADYRFKIEVRKLVLSGTQPSYSVGAGDPLSVTPTHSGQIDAVSYSIAPAASELPAGVGFNTETGAISGTPAVEFAEKSFTVTATDGAYPPQTVSYSVTIKVNPSAKAPRVAITAGSGVTEGGSASFTVTA